jgi:signal transduction histidine kinase
MGLAGMTASKNNSLTPEILIPRLGSYLVDLGLITKPDLEKALAIQTIARAKGESPLIGQVLIDMGSISREQLDNVITEQILRLRDALQEANQTLELRVQQRTHELEEAYQKLSELSKQKANFVQNISHELRTPMTHLKGYLGLLRSGDLGEMNNDQKQALDVMSNSSDRLERLIEDLIMFAMMDQKRVTLEKAPVRINDLILKALENIRKKTDPLIQLNSELTPENPWVDVDSQKILWAITELIRNSIKFTPSNGAVKITSVAGVKKVEITVKDTGVGIPLDQIKKIFEPFYQIDGSTSRKVGGTGLGLSLVQEIFQAHGSEVKVESTPGEGSRFFFNLETKDSH